MTLLDSPQIYGSRDLTEIHAVFRGDQYRDPALFRARITQTVGGFNIRVTAIQFENQREIEQQIVADYDLAKFLALVALERAVEAYAAVR